MKDGFCPHPKPVKETIKKRLEKLRKCKGEIWWLNSKFVLPGLRQPYFSVLNLFKEVRVGSSQTKRSGGTNTATKAILT